VGDKDVGTLTGYPYYYGSDGAANENRTFHQLTGKGLPAPGEEYDGIYTVGGVWVVEGIRAK